MAVVYSEQIYVFQSFSLDVIMSSKNNTSKSKSSFLSSKLSISGDRWVFLALFVMTQSKLSLGYHMEPKTYQHFHALFFGLNWTK